jgi:hypothetical protein
LKLIAMAAGLALTTASYASVQLVSMAPDPVSKDLSEVIWSGAALQTGPGSVGNNDGTLPQFLQTAGGYQVQTPLHIEGVAGSQINDNGTPLDTSDDSTVFFDVTMVLNGLPGSGALQVDTVAGMQVFTQPIGQGTYQLLGTDGTLLLQGTISNALFIGIKLAGEDSGSVQSTAVSFDAGKIVDALPPAEPKIGSLSWSLLDLNLADGGGMLAPFTANLTGLFSTIPEPASISLLGFGALALLRRSRKA